MAKGAKVSLIESVQALFVPNAPQNESPGASIIAGATAGAIEGFATVRALPLRLHL
jgi:hypothetical protein